MVLLVQPSRTKKKLFCFVVPHQFKTHHLNLKKRRYLSSTYFSWLNKNGVVFLDNYGSTSQMSLWPNNVPPCNVPHWNSNKVCLPYHVMLVWSILIHFGYLSCWELALQRTSLIGPSQKSFETLETPQYKNIHWT